ncbi:MAG: hypothetical protein ACYC5F_09760 [Thermoleophilia bacterium]
MSGFGWKIDLRRAVEATVRKKCEDAVGDLAEYVLETANRTCPIEEHMLEGSGSVSQDGLTAAVSYDTVYAARQHEETTWRHDAGRRAKWLELTFKEEESRARDYLAKKIGF